MLALPKKRDSEVFQGLEKTIDLLKKVISGGESWLYYIKSKAQSSQWKRPEVQKSKKARQVQSNVKVSLSGFFDCKGVVHHEFLPQGRTVNKEYYLEVVGRLCKPISQKRTELWKTNHFAP